MNHRLKLENIIEAQRAIDPVFLNSPQLMVERWCRRLGLRVVIKDETANPIRCFKGRGAEYLASQLPPYSRLVTVSAGNFGQALAFACGRRGHELTVYAAENARAIKLERMRELGAKVVQHGADFEEAKQEAKRVAARQGLRMIVDSLEPATGEGAGTIGIELAAFRTRFDAVVLALGDGALTCGVGRYLKWASPTTRIVAVQAAGAPAMLESWRKKEIVTHRTTTTMADGIAVRNPMPECVDDLEGILDEGLTVTEASLREAVQWAHHDAGLTLEPAGAATLAALIQHRDLFQNQTVAIVFCGGNISPEDHAKLLGSGSGQET